MNSEAWLRLRAGLLKIAVHEAGHTVVALRLGLRPRMLSIHASGSGDQRYAGGGLHSDPPKHDREGCLDGITMAMAGLAAESILKSTEHFERDQSPAEIKAYAEGRGDLWDADQYLDMLQPPPSKRGRRRFIDDGWKRARRILVENSEALRNLSDAATDKAMAYGHEPFNVTIEGEELAELLNATNPSGGE